MTDILRGIAEFWHVFSTGSGWVFALSLILGGPLVAQNFELVKNSDGIQVYNRKRTGSDLKEFRGVTRMKASLSSLVAILIDTASFNRWMRHPEIIESQL